MYITKMFIVHSSLTLLHVSSHQPQWGAQKADWESLRRRSSGRQLWRSSAGPVARGASSLYQQPGAGQLAILHHPHCVYQILCQHENWKYLTLKEWFHICRYIYNLHTGCPKSQYWIFYLLFCQLICDYRKIQEVCNRRWAQKF